MTGDPAALALDDVAVGYGDADAVLGVSFRVAPGQWLAVIGPNGAGKSTVLRAVAGVLRFRGRIEVGGRPHRNRAETARQVAYVPQLPILPIGMTTAEYVMLGRTAHLSMLRSESAADRRRVAAVLDHLDLSAMAGRPVDALSGGEAQRATLARALVQEASVLVLDEPTSALDLAHQISVLELVDRLRAAHRLAVVTAMHDLSIASRFADRLLLMADGRPVATGPAAEVLTEPVLSRYYRTPVSVMAGPDGGVLVVPLRSKGSGPAPDQPERQAASPEQHSTLEVRT